MKRMRETRTARPKVQRFSDDGGAVLAEAALVTPIFIFMLFGILEFGGAFRDYLTLSNVVVTGTRQEAIWGSSLQADWKTLDAIHRGNGALDLDNLDYIVVWKASAGTDKVPSGCKSGAASFAGGTITAPAIGACNVYTAADIRDKINGPQWTCSGPKIGPIQYYCPSGRKVTVLADPDYLGVYVQIQHPWVTGLFGQEVQMSDQSVTKLEPQKIA